MSKTNIPTNSTLNKQDMDRIKMVARTVSNFIEISSNTLLEKLENKYSNKGTMNVIAYTLKKFFEEIGEDKKAEFWSEAGKELGREVYDEEMRSELTNNEKKNWKTQSEIMEIMNNIPIKDRTDYNRFLLLAMATFQPPLRKSFYQSVKFATTPGKLNKKDNFILLNKHPNKCFYVVNIDKVSKYDKFNEDNSKYIEISDPQLCKLLRDSYKQNPRTYVFETDEGKPYSINSISIILLERPFNLNFNILRSSYVSNFYKHNPYPKEKHELATKMRHSADIAQLSYLKRGKGYEEDTDNE
jgi:hypothetical protein